MSQIEPVRRFRANPVEVAIFSVIMLVFSHSVYSLFYDSQVLYTASIAHSYAATTEVSPDRSIASMPSVIATNVLDLDIKCQNKTSLQTPAGKVRIAGPLCGMGDTPHSNKLIKAVLENKKNSFQATIFPDAFHGKFSTDYIPLELGENNLKMEFKYLDGESFRSEIAVLKTEMSE